MMKGLVILATALCTSSVSAFVTPTARAPVSFTTVLEASSTTDNNSGTNKGIATALKKVGEAALASTLCFGMLLPINSPVYAASDIDYRLPPIDRSDPDRCVLKSSAIGQSNAQRDKLFDLRECKLEGANAQGFDLSGVIMTKTDVSKANFVEAYFSKGYMHDSKFDGADFTNAIVDRASFQGSSLRGAVFKNAVLTGTSFEGADVEGVDFTEAAIGNFDQRNLCKNPTLKGQNPVTGEDTRFSVGCP